MNKSQNPTAKEIRELIPTKSIRQIPQLLQTVSPKIVQFSNRWGIRSFQILQNNINKQIVQYYYQCYIK